jgi:Protein of unknown function (DUF1616)
MRDHADLKAACWLALICALGALLVPLDPLSLLFALPLCLFLPGYGIAAAAFARHPIDPARFALLALGLSLAVLALGALPLNYLPWGIRAGWWALLFYLVVVGSCRAAALRRPRRAGAPIELPRLRVNGAQAALLGGGALAVLAAFVLAFTPLAADKAIGYTELWIKPLSSGVQVGIGSGESEDSSYRLEVEFSDDSAPVVQRFELAPGERQVLEIEDGTPNAGNDLPIAATATLFKEDSPGRERPFRQVSTWIAPEDAG